MSDEKKMDKPNDSSKQQNSNEITPKDETSRNAESGETISEPTPSTNAAQANDAPSEANDSNARSTTPTALRDFEGRRLYFSNVCSTVAPHALHCIFRSYGAVRTFHYDTTLHYGYVVYMERENALLARYGVDGLILGSRAIRVYYPPYKPRHPTRYCYNCREMGHFIQNCPYTNANNWDYNYSPLYNNGQPVIDNMTTPASPMVQQYPGSLMPTIIYPPIPAGQFPGHPPGTATVMYQPGWPAQSLTPTYTSAPYVQTLQQPLNPIMQHQPQPAANQHLNPTHPPMHLGQQLINNIQQPLNQMPQAAQLSQHVSQMQQPISHLQQPVHLGQQIINQVHQPMQHPFMAPLIQPSAPSLISGIMQPTPTYPIIQQPIQHQLIPNLGEIIQEQANIVFQQHITPMVQQVISQVLQDQTLVNIQQSMMQQNMEQPTPTSRSDIYTFNEETESAKFQPESTQNGSYTTNEQPLNLTQTLNHAQQSMYNHHFPMMECVNRQVRLPTQQHLVHDKIEQKNSFEVSSKGSTLRQRVMNELDERVPTKPLNTEIPYGTVHSVSPTSAQKPVTSIAQLSHQTKTTHIHNTSVMHTSANPVEAMAGHQTQPTEQSRNSSSSDLNTPNSYEQPIQSADNSHFYSPFPYQLPSTIFFTLPPIVVNITAPAPNFNPKSASDTKITCPPPYDTVSRNVSENYDLIAENERTFREFENIVQDDEQNFVINEEHLRAQQINNAIPTQQSVEVSTKQTVSPSPTAPSRTPTTLVGPRIASSGNSPRSNTTSPAKTSESCLHSTVASPRSSDELARIIEGDRQRLNRLKLRALLMEESDQAIATETKEGIVPSSAQTKEEDTVEKRDSYNELISTMNTSCNEIENLFSNFSSLVGSPEAKKCLEQIRSKSETDILKLSQKLLDRIIHKNTDESTDAEGILGISKDILDFENEQLASTSTANPATQKGALIAKVRDEHIESSRSENDSKKEDSDDGNHGRKRQWKKNKKRRR